MPQSDFAAGDASQSEGLGVSVRGVYLRERSAKGPATSSRRGRINRHGPARFRTSGAAVLTD